MAYKVDILILLFLLLTITFIVSADINDNNMLREKRWTRWGDLGAWLSPYNTVAANHRRYPNYNGNGGRSNFWQGWGR